MKKVISIFACGASFIAYGMQHENGIFPYKEENKQEVCRIARANLGWLASGNISNEKRANQLMDSQIITALDVSLVNPEDVICKVYKNDGLPVGFVTYRIYTPWYKKIILTQKEDKDAKIFHLAVCANSRGRGYGSSLLEDAIHDCKSQGVSQIKLNTTGADSFGNLRPFYEKFKFEQKFIDARRGHAYTLSLKPQASASSIIFKIIGLLTKHW
jgi:GNAT superfamily N-acetyltransferase